MLPSCSVLYYCTVIPTEACPEYMLHALMDLTVKYCKGNKHFLNNHVSCKALFLCIPPPPLILINVLKKILNLINVRALVLGGIDWGHKKLFHELFYKEHLGRVICSTRKGSFKILWGAKSGSSMALSFFKTVLYYFNILCIKPWPPYNEFCLKQGSSVWDEC